MILDFPRNVARKPWRENGKRDNDREKKGTVSWGDVAPSTRRKSLVGARTNTDGTLPSVFRRTTLTLSSLSDRFAQTTKSSWTPIPNQATPTLAGYRRLICRFPRWQWACLEHSAGDSWDWRRWRSTSCRNSGDGSPAGRKTRHVSGHEKSISCGNYSSPWDVLTA